jgi:hypothetical protein
MGLEAGGGVSLLTAGAGAGSGIGSGVAELVQPARVKPINKVNAAVENIFFTIVLFEYDRPCSSAVSFARGGQLFLNIKLKMLSSSHIE